MLVSIQNLMSQSDVRFGTSGVRGLINDMSDTVCYAYTMAFIAAATNPHDDIVVLGHDLRPSSPKIARACAAAIRGAGKEAVYIGALPTPAVAWYAQTRHAPAIMVTGSHIPFDRNGIKFYRVEGEISKTDEAVMQTTSVNVPTTLQSPNLPPLNLQAWSSYVQRYVSFFGADALHGMRVALYEHSSVGRDVLRQILELLGAQVLSLGRTDTFVPIDTEAVHQHDIEQARQWAMDYHFDAIVSTDGDADRPLIGDENGHWLRGDITGLLCSRFLAATHVITPVSSNTAVEQCGWFAHVTRTKIGSPYVIAAMADSPTQEQDITVGYEANGGFLLGSNVSRQAHTLNALPTRDAVLPILALLMMAREQQCTLSQLCTGLPQRYTASHRLANFPTEISAQLLTTLQQDSTYAASVLAPNAGAIRHIDTTDGLRVTFANHDIVHLRPSGNAPELRCYTESNTQYAAQYLCEACLNRIRV